MWVYEKAINLIGKLPVRANPDQGVYVWSGTTPIQSLVCHYLGDRTNVGSAEGYGILTPEAVANYQTTVTDNWHFPEIAYSFQIQPDGSVYQLQPLEKETWHASAANYYSRGILFTGFGKLGQPTQAAKNSCCELFLAVEKQLGREMGLLAHKEVSQTECPGDIPWVQEVRDMLDQGYPAVLLPKPAPVPGFEIINSYEWLCTATGFKVSYRALELYKEWNGLFWLGYPRSDWHVNEHGMLVQLYQRARLEIKPQYHHGNGNVDIDVPYYEVFQLGLLGDEMLHAKGELA